MSPDLRPRIGFAESTIQQLYTSQYCTLAAIALLYYDHLLTLQLEIQHIWKSKMTILNCLFLLNRYSVFFGYIIFLFFQFDSPEDDTLCANFKWVIGSFVYLTQAVIVAIFILRCYALYYGNYLVLSIVTMLGVSSVATSVWTVTDVKTLNLPFGPQGVFRTCLINGTTTRTSSYVCTLATSLGFDILVLILTAVKTYPLTKESRNAGIKSRLTELLIRDGILYFLGLTTINIANLVISTVAPASQGIFAEGGTGNNSVLTHILSATLASRLVLNLRHLDAKKLHYESSHFAKMSSWLARGGISENTPTSGIISEMRVYDEMVPVTGPHTTDLEAGVVHTPDEIQLGGTDPTLSEGIIVLDRHIG